MLHRTIAFAFAAFIAAIAGVLFVWWNGHIDPASIDLGSTIDVLVIAVIGGLYRVEGAWVGALFFVVINNYSQQISFIGPRFHTLIGAIFLVIVLVSPGGLIGLWEACGHADFRRAARGPTNPSSTSARPSPASERRPRPSDIPLRRLQLTPQNPRNQINGSKGGGHPNECSQAQVEARFARSDRGSPRPRCSPTTATARSSATPIKIAVLSDCQGAFGSFDNQDMAGVVTAMAQFAGGEREEPEQAA